MRGLGEVGPLARRVAKLIKYLNAGRSVEVDGNIYCLKKEGDGAYGSKLIPVNDWTMEEIMALADGLDGQSYIDVMNFKNKKEIL